MRAACLFLFGALLSAGPANADEPRRFALDYSAAAPCPTEAELLVEIQMRAPTAQRVAAGAGEVSARVSIASVGKAHWGVIDIEGGDGPTHREIEAPECAEVAHAAALVLALAIDPDAHTAPAVIEPRGAPLHASEPRAPQRLAEPTAVGARLSWNAGTRLGISGGVAPGLALDQGLFFELRRGRTSNFFSSLAAHCAARARTRPKPRTRAPLTSICSHCARRLVLFALAHVQRCRHAPASMSDVCRAAARTRSTRKRARHSGLDQAGSSMPSSGCCRGYAFSWKSAR